MAKIKSKGLENFKNEVAHELGLNDFERIDKGDLTTREVGLVGGNMVKKMVEFAEEELSK